MKIPNILFKAYLEPEENILDIFHRHPFVIFPDLLRIALFGFIIPVFLYYLFPEFALIFVIWMLISLVRFVYVIVGWYYDTILVTNVSLLSVKWNGFFDRTSTRLEYAMIEGITCENRGVIQTIFNYGLVGITRAGAGTTLSLPEAINPKKVERKIMAYQEHFVTDQSMKDSDTLKSLLTTMIRQHAKNEGVAERETE
jgi:hypothetical protein